MENAELAAWLEKVEKKVDDVSYQVAKINGQNNLIPILVKWVIFPLLLIMGGLVGLDMTGVID